MAWYSDPMRSQDAKTVLESLRLLHRGIGRISEADLLTVLARDLEPNNTKDRDKVHTSIGSLCNAINTAADQYGAAANIMEYLRDKAPKPGRQSQLVDCIRCNELCLPRPISGFCSSCFAEWQAFKGEHNGDLAAFIAAYGKIDDAT